MLRSQYNQPSKPSFVTELLDRIYQLQSQDEREKYLKRFKLQCLYVLLIISILFFFQNHNHIYNAWYGPFHLNLGEFITHWNIYSGKTSSTSWTFFNKEYIQIELGQDKININPRYTFEVHNRDLKYASASYRFHRINIPSINNGPMTLLVKLPTNLVAHFHKRLPYRFELLNSNTLKCIAEEIEIDQSTINIKQIEEIYDRNPADFNLKVTTMCGVLIGYLYDGVKQKVFTLDSYEPYVFSSKVAAFDASTSYLTYWTYIITSLLILWCIRIVLEIFHIFIWYIYQTSENKVLHEINDILKMFNIDSIQSLDRLLMEAYQTHDYYDQLFLVRKECLLIFKIDLNEHDPIILRQFYKKSPFSIINIETIVEINHSDILAADNGFQNPVPLRKIDAQRNKWLHDRLMNYSTNYRQQEAIRTNDMTRRNRLTAYMKEEEEIQRVNNNDIERIWDRTASASPRFIAEFRLEGPETLNTRLPKTKCVICREQFQIGDQYSLWPCAGPHMFHYECMLQVLRKQNQCPLCRHAVEAACLPSIYNIFGMLLAREHQS